MEEVVKIVQELKSGKFKPIYFLHGEEPYYIDRLSDFIQHEILNDLEKEFNLTVLYGKDVSAEDVVSQAKRFPMMADKQVVIIKEAQDLSKQLDKLENYFTHPQPSTILVFCYKYSTLDKRKKITKLIDQNGVLFESKKIKDYQLSAWIKKTVSEKSFTIDTKAADMLAEFLGNDLNKIDNELKKLMLVVPKGVTITPLDIEKNIGFSKDFNVFELRKAIAQNNAAKSFQIVDYFANNPKENPVQKILPQVISFFIQTLQYHGLANKSSANVAQTLKINEYFVKDYSEAASYFPMKKVSLIISGLREIDMKSKGVESNNIPSSELYKEMLIKIFA